MSKETKFEGRFLKFINDGTWEYVERKNCTGIVIIIGVNTDNKVIFVEQFRKSLGKNIIEFPAGLVGDTSEDESFETAALRELEEETGYTAESIELLVDGPTAPGLTNEVVSFLMAKNLKKVSAGGGVENEKITVHEVDINDVDSWLKGRIAQGNLIDLKVYGCLYFLRNSVKS